jgi:hypothetical protein
MKTELRWAKGQEYMPQQGPHRYHLLQVVNVKEAGPEHDRVSVSCLTCQGYFHFLDRWGYGL